MSVGQGSIARASVDISSPELEKITSRSSTSTLLRFQVSLAKEAVSDMTRSIDAKRAERFEGGCGRRKGIRRDFISDGMPGNAMNHEPKFI